MTDKTRYPLSAALAVAAETNTRIATEAQRRGIKWNPYGPGFTHLATGETIPVHTEEDVFKTVGLKPAKPEERT